MAATKQQLKVKQILEDIKSDDPKKVSKSIKSLETHGDSSVILPLAERLLAGMNRKNEEEVVELLSSLKDTSSVVEVMDVIGNSKFLPIRPLMLSTVWNTKVDFSDYIDEFVEIAVSGTLICRLPVFVPKIILLTDEAPALEPKPNTPFGVLLFLNCK